jgi:GAF domain-containing protein
VDIFALFAHDHGSTFAGEELLSFPARAASSRMSITSPAPYLVPREDARLDIFEQTAERARQLIQDGASERAVLTCLVGGTEAAAGDGSVCSILLLDGDGLLRNGASPNLPRDYLDAIDRLKPNPNVGTCAAVAATGQIIFTPDFCDDNKWAELRHLPMQLGFVGAWSAPILHPENGQVLGTFGTYFREKRAPSPAEIAGVQRLAKLAATAIVQNSQ